MVPKSMTFEAEKRSNSRQCPIAQSTVMVATDVKPGQISIFASRQRNLST